MPVTKQVITDPPKELPDLYNLLFPDSEGEEAVKQVPVTKVTRPNMLESVSKGSR